MITKLDIGFQLHNIFSPLITILPSSKPRIFNWEYNGKDKLVAQAIYDTQLKSEAKITNLSYCPMSNFLHKVFKNRPYTKQEAEELLASVVPAARLESRYQYRDSGTSESYSLHTIKDVPFDMTNIQLITPEQFRTVSHDERFELAATKRVDKLVADIQSITLPKNKLLAEYNRLINGLLNDMSLV